LLYPTQLDALDLVRKVTVVNDADQQNAYLLANQYPQRRNLQAVVNEKKTSIKLELLDLTADDQLRQQITLTIPNAWSGPKQIEL
jgi:phosphate uptake regulator